MGSKQVEMRIRMPLSLDITSLVGASKIFTNHLGKVLNQFQQAYYAISLYIKFKEQGEVKRRGCGRQCGVPVGSFIEAQMQASWRGWLLIQGAEVHNKTQSGGKGMGTQKPNSRLLGTCLIFLAYKSHQP